MKSIQKACVSLFLFGCGFILLGFINPYLKALFNSQSPQLILVLGGDVDREHVGLTFANELNLPLVLTGGSNREYANWLVKKSGIPPSQVMLDYRAGDTLENFTYLVDDLFLKGISHALLITSEDHIARAMTVGQVVAGSRGIRLTGISVPCNLECPQERFQKRFIDLIRAIVWVIIGKDMKVWAEQSWPDVFAKG